MERLLQYIWKYRLYTATDLQTVDGDPITVIDPGIQNTDAGPDFFNAKIRMGSNLWAGNVEIHRKASDWKSHHHDNDPSYDTVILHVVGEYDAVVYRSTGEMIPQAIIRVPETIKNNMNWLLLRDTPLPCAERIHEIEPVLITGWMNTLLTERLERKVADTMKRLEQSRDDWNEVFYITLMRNFGFKNNGDVFESLAKSLPFKYIRKQSHNAQQIEALLFGQAGLLQQTLDDPYYEALQREYRFLQQKYKLSPVDPGLIKLMRIRPINFPHLRIAHVATLWAHHDNLFSRILEGNAAETITASLKTPLPAYWDTHYTFVAHSPAKKKTIGQATINSIQINTVAPMLFAYGTKKRKPDYCTQAIDMLASLPPERNSLIKRFTDAGLSVQNASDSQALIQLRCEYCEKKKCLYCRIGFHLIKK